METTVVLIVAAIAGAAMIGSAVVRIVPAGHCAVVIRAGRPVRSKPSGPITVLPGVDRVEMVPVHPRPIDPLIVIALTQDAVEVRLVVSLQWTITDPMRTVQASPDVRTATAEGVERALRHAIANVDLTTLLRDREALLSRLPVTAQPLLAPLGVELVDADFLDAEVRVGPELLRLLA